MVKEKGWEKNSMWSAVKGQKGREWERNRSPQKAGKRAIGEAEDPTSLPDKVRDAPVSGSPTYPLTVHVSELELVNLGRPLHPRTQRLPHTPLTSTTSTREAETYNMLCAFFKKQNAKSPHFCTFFIDIHHPCEHTAQSLQVKGVEA